MQLKIAFKFASAKYLSDLLNQINLNLVIKHAAISNPLSSQMISNLLIETKIVCKSCTV